MKKLRFFQAKLFWWHFPLFLWNLYALWPFSLSTCARWIMRQKFVRIFPSCRQNFDHNHLTSWSLTLGKKNKEKCSKCDKQKLYFSQKILCSSIELLSEPILWLQLFCTLVFIIIIKNYSFLKLNAYFSKNIKKSPFRTNSYSHRMKNSSAFAFMIIFQRSIVISMEGFSFHFLVFSYAFLSSHVKVFRGFNYFFFQATVGFSPRRY